LEERWTFNPVVRGSSPLGGILCERGVVVSMGPFQGLVPGSIPGVRIKYILNALLAQWIARWTSNPAVASSSLAEGV
tara:strand:+ start:810 stop:1040 length:231 start_codon:yes stop_codon:yes gene_type:complete